MRTKLMQSGLAAAVLLTTAAGARGDDQKDIVATAVGAGSFQTLAAALQAADLVDDLQGEGPFTVFAPTDEAFSKLPEGTVETLLKPENRDQIVSILTYHVVPGSLKAADIVTRDGLVTLNGQRLGISASDEGVQVDSASVAATDIVCSNGVIHVIDSVIQPASDDIPTTATNAGNFSTLLAALDAAGLAEALSGEGPFTVFAPTDGAFEKLPAGTLESLLEPRNRERLISILKYHVVEGRVYSDAAVAAERATTLQGSPVHVVIQGEQAMVNNASLVTTDIDASNGVIHVIDHVLLPPSADSRTNSTGQTARPCR